MDYQKLCEVNKALTYTDIHGKKYAEVSQKVQGFRKLYPDGYITTDILKMEGLLVFMKAEAGYYAKDGSKVVLATGLAYERQDASNINRTSFIENCETSAIGRALSFIGIGSESSIASVEELQNAINTQEAIEQGLIPGTLPTQGTVETVPSLPPVNNPPANNPPEQTPPPVPQNPVGKYLSEQREELRKLRNIDRAENTDIWNKQIAVLRENKKVPTKALSAYTMKEAQDLVNFMYTLFDPKGTVLKDVIDGQTA